MVNKVNITEVEGSKIGFWGGERTASQSGPSRVPEDRPSSLDLGEGVRAIETL
jgi:hypothetical protein